MRPVEDYASYDQPMKCHKPYAETKLLGRWVAKRYGGGYVSTSRTCSRRRPVTSDHQTGRAIDWSADIARRSDRMHVRRLIHDLFKAGQHGDPRALARRMGIVYVIWNDNMYASWRRFHPEPYLSASCTTKKKCSKTLRHRNHVHISLSRAGALGRTSWFDDRL